MTRKVPERYGKNTNRAQIERQFQETVAASAVVGSQEESFPVAGTGQHRFPDVKPRTPVASPSKLVAAFTRPLARAVLIVLDLRRFNRDQQPLQREFGVSKPGRRSDVPRASERTQRRRRVQCASAARGGFVES